MLALAIVAVPAMAQDASAMGGKGIDILGNGIFESSDNAFKFPILTDTNFDSITIGNDNARAIGWEGFFPSSSAPAKAANNLEVKKNQQVGVTSTENTTPLVNIDQVHIGDRMAQAFGNAEAVNNVKVVLNQAR